MRPLQRLLKASYGGTGGLDMGNAIALPIGAWGRPLVNGRESIDNDFESYVNEAYKANGIVFACIAARQMPFSEVRFQYQRLNGGRPGELFGAPSLSLLENPWPNGTTGELLSHMEQDVSLAGNFFAARRGDRIRRLRPDWVTIVSGVPGDGRASAYSLDAEVLAYIYRPPNEEGVVLTPAEVVHYSPTPDPTAQWRGMSWLQSVVMEIMSDSAATKHKHQFFKQGTLSNLAVIHSSDLTPERFKEDVALFEEMHSGASGAYKTLHFGGGADVKALGADLRAVDFKAVQGAGESRIAAAAGVGGIMARLSEGMQGSSLNQGNYNSAKRQFVDMTLRPLWRTASASLAKFADVPAGARLWYDARDISFLAEDADAAAEILAKAARSIRELTDAGYSPDAVVAAVMAGDLSLLKGNHSGLYSVQLNPVGGGDATKQEADKAREIAELIQKLYLGVGVVLSAEEARVLVARAGGNVTGPLPTPPAA